MGISEAYDDLKKRGQEAYDNFNRGVDLIRNDPNAAMNIVRDELSAADRWVRSNAQQYGDIVRNATNAYDPNSMSTLAIRGTMGIGEALYNIGTGTIKTVDMVGQGLGHFSASIYNRDWGDALGVMYSGGDQIIKMPGAFLDSIAQDWATASKEGTAGAYSEFLGKVGTDVGAVFLGGQGAVGAVRTVLRGGAEAEGTIGAIAKGAAVDESVAAAATAGEGLSSEGVASEMMCKLPERPRLELGDRLPAKVGEAIESPLESEAPVLSDYITDGTYKNVEDIPGHGHAEHGAQMSVADHTAMLEKGPLREGVQYDPKKASTSFYRPELELDAVNRALQNPRSVIFQVNRKGVASAMPRIVEYVEGPPGGYGSGLKKQPGGGPPIELQQLPSAKVVLELDPSTGRYSKPITQHPSGNTPTIPRR